MADYLEKISEAEVFAVLQDLATDSGLGIEATTAKGEPYRNHYHFAFRLRDAQIIAAKEYVDTLYAQRMLFDPALSDAP